jgi:hypothetical protein
MDSKKGSEPEPYMFQTPHHSPNLFLAMHSFMGSLLLLPATLASAPFLLLQAFNYQKTTLDVKVPVQLGVMSRCPDALLCENVFDQVLKKVADKVDLSLLFVAK